MPGSSNFITRLQDVILPVGKTIRSASAIFLVMDKMKCDLGKLLKSAEEACFEEKHAVSFLY